MLTIFRSTKGGSGTTTVTAGLAGLLGRRAAPRTAHSVRVLAIDLCGDLPAVLGTATPLSGLSEWLDRSAHHDFDEVHIDCGQSVHLVPTGSSTLPDPSSPAWNRLISVIDDHLDHGAQVVVDVGTGSLPLVFAEPNYLACAGGTQRRVLLVIRPCYLALRRAIEESGDDGIAADGIVLVNGGDRVLTRRDVESVLGVPVVAEVPLDPDVARRVDSGLFLSRLPASLVSALDSLVGKPTP